MYRLRAYRLMVLTRTRHVVPKAYGSLSYLHHIASRAKQTRGRQWIELNVSPSVKKNHRGYAFV